MKKLGGAAVGMLLAVAALGSGSGSGTDAEGAGPIGGKPNRMRRDRETGALGGLWLGPPPWSHRLKTRRRRAAMER